MSKNKQNISVPNKEVFGRMNFLYQASMLMANQSNSVLSAYYARQCQSIGKKAQLKMLPEVKRNFCKRCALAQRLGTTTDLEISQNENSKVTKKPNAEDENIDVGANVYMKCRKCGSKRRLIVNPKYNFWPENPKAVEEIRLQQTENIKNNNEPNSNKKNEIKNNTKVPKDNKTAPKKVLN